MSVNNSNNHRQGVKRDAQGQPKPVGEPAGDHSAELRRVLEQIPTWKLVSIFEPPLRENLRYRLPAGNVDKIMEDLKRDMNREKLLQIAELLPQVMKELKESNYHHASQIQSNELAGTLSSETQMEIVPQTSPPPPYKTHTGVILLDPSSTNPSVAPDISPEEARPPSPELEPTVIHGLYTPGKGKNKTSERTFDISEENYVRALAWSRRFYRFDRSNEHLVYHYKAVLTSDVQKLFAVLAKHDIVEPRKPSSLNDSSLSNSELQETFKQAQVKYHRIVAQSVYKLPTVWPPNADYLVDLNHDKSRELCPSGESDPYLDITDIIRQGSNIFTLIEFKDAQRYTFCLFEKAPTAEEIDLAVTL